LLVDEFVHLQADAFNGGFYFFAVDVDVDAAGAGFCHKWGNLWQR